MRVLVLHNVYQLKGGEETVVEAETALLRRAGHEVIVRTVTNDQIRSLGDRVSAFLKAGYDPARASWVQAQLQETQAELVHVHNFFPLLTPAVHEAAAAVGTPVVQTLHNFRLVCANALLLRNGATCEKCVTGTNLWGVVHRCYRGSVAGSFAVTRMQDRMRRSDSVHRYIVLTDFARDKFVSAGLPRDRLVVKPNFVSDARAVVPPGQRGRHAVFVGRLSPEKGAGVLVEAWSKIPDRPLIIVGDGPELPALRAVAPPSVTFAGRLQRDEVYDLVGSASMLVVPSLWYEGFPMVVVEALALGTPVVASRLGSLAEIVDDDRTGIHFNPGDADDLTAKVSALAGDTDRLARMSGNARATFLDRYTDARNLEMLEAIYGDAVALARSQRGSRR